MGQFDHLLVEYLAKNTDNIYLYLNSRGAEQHEAWAILKSNFNYELTKGQSNPESSNEIVASPFQNAKYPELRNAIENEFKPLRAAFNNESDYLNTIQAIEDFFSTGNIIAKPIFVKNGNIKNLAYALSQIWRHQRNEIINYNYLQFYIQTFSVFAGQRIDESNIFGCNLYKYSISRT